MTAETFGIAMGGHDDRPRLSGSGVVERTIVPPPGFLVEGPGPGVPGYNRQPGHLVSAGSDLSFGLSHQGGGHARSSMASRHIDLFDLIIHDHDKPGDGAVDSCHGRVFDPLGGPGPKGLFGPGLDQFQRDRPAVAILPTEAPDLGDLIRIRGSGVANRHLGTGREHKTNLSSEMPGIEIEMWRVFLPVPTKEELMVASIRYIVTDVREAVEFYRDHLDFNVEIDAAPGFAALSRDDMQLLLNAPGAGGAGRAGGDPMPGGWNRFQLVVDDLGETVERLRSEGVTFRGEVVKGNAGHQIIAEDPSGNPIELFQPLD